jgi:4'-phosphopantetheinyl transferase
VTEVGWLAATREEVRDRRDWLSPAERDRAQAFRFERRRSEWLLGRWTAKAAVTAWLGPEAPRPWDIAILTAEDGAPEALVDGDGRGPSISISHRAGRGLAAVARAGVRLGADLEVVEPRTEGFILDYFTDDEAGAVLGRPAEERALLATLVWSAKESGLKVLRTGLRSDTRRIVVDVPTGDPSEAWADLSMRDADTGRPLQGWWRPWGAFVITVAVDQTSRRGPSTPGPRALHAPPGWADAHSGEGGAA